MGMSLKSIYKRGETGMAMYWWQEEDSWSGRQQYKAHPCSLESEIHEIFKVRWLK
jgi:hypothetical protein